MSQMIKVFFKTQDGKRHQMEVDTNITVDRMIANFLEKRKTILQLNDYSFIVNSLPLTKDVVLKKKVKHVRQLKPDCVIQVRKVDNLDGSNQ